LNQDFFEKLSIYNLLPTLHVHHKKNETGSNIPKTVSK